MPALRVLAVGEALVDWVCTERGASLAEARVFTKAPGGAPMNVAVGLARLGVPAAFAGCVGADPFGEWLRELMAAEGVDTALVATLTARQTRMAYVVTNGAGDRELAAFSDVACADEALSASHLPDAALASARAFYFGSLILQREPSSSAVLDAAQRVQQGPGLVVFDPNIRPVLWPDAVALSQVLDEALGVCDVVKLGLEELAFLVGDGPPEAGAQRLLEAHGNLAAVVLTDGAQGAGVYTASAALWVPSYPVQAVDATGAGDGFVAGLLAGVLGALGDRPKASLAAWPAAVWEPVLKRACAVGAIATTRAGAISALPTEAELDAFLQASLA
jgi:sugar/nucleoside kinase (ribokinase family)